MEVITWATVSLSVVVLTCRVLQVVILVLPYLGSLGVVYTMVLLYFTQLEYWSTIRLFP